MPQGEQSSARTGSAPERQCGARNPKIRIGETIRRNNSSFSATWRRRLVATSFIPRKRIPSSMILTGEEIHNRLGSDILIDPFEECRLNPNSYNLRLHNELLVYEEVVLDLRAPNRFRRIEIPAEGIVLQPGTLYLGRTVERTETRNLVPMIEGRSSISRLGLFVHATAGFGDVGFCGYWTLEMFTIQPIRVYANVEICQIFYHQLIGNIREYCSSKYQDNRDIQPSMLYRELGVTELDSQLELDFDDCLGSAKRI